MFDDKFANSLTIKVIIIMHTLYVFRTVKKN